jgi:CheY-like chemotaxis protein
MIWMKRILVIDDDEALRQLIRQMLERSNYEVIDAPNGKVGVDIYRSDPLDLVITDIFMPEKEGLETIRELCREYPDVKIIAISGGSPKTEGFSSLQFAKGFGALRTLDKPFFREELLRMVKELLGETMP